jgi:4-amino-4-deoxychorismate lyase
MSLLRARINGQEGSELPVLDRGLHYGDGVFRTLRVEQGVPRNRDRQLARLYDDARRIGLVPPDARMLTEEVMQLCAGQPPAVLKIILTRGSGGRGYQADAAATPTRILLLYAMPEYPAAHWRDGIRVRICDTRLAQNPRLAGIKHLNRIEQVLARAEWNEPAIAEGLMLDTGGRLIEGVSSNLFLARDGVLLTPDLSRCGIGGLMREMILESASAYTRAVQIRDLNIDDLLAADECMVCNSVIGIWPVTQLDERRWPVGPVTRSLQRQLDEA